jgi:hypothetical protein
MTVIATLITNYGTVHATDSLISRDLPDGKREYLEYKRPKIIKVRAFRGAMSYWGLAELENMWMLDWLKREAGQANKYSTAEDFALAVADHLTQVLSRTRFQRIQHRGIGIHFTAYERVGDYWVPELFLLSNFVYSGDGSYTISSGRVDVSRHTYKTTVNEHPAPEHRKPSYRLAVHQFLQNDRILRYNNGDPILFNPIANALFDSLKELRKRRVLKQPDLEMFRRLSKSPIEFVAGMQSKDFCEPDTKLVGGEIHSMSITPEGNYFPDKD